MIEPEREGTEKSDERGREPRREKPFAAINPFPTLHASDACRVLYASLTPPVTSGDGGPAPSWVGYGYVGRKYSRLHRPLDVALDCQPDFGLGKHAP